MAKKSDAEIKENIDLIEKRMACAFAMALNVVRDEMQKRSPKSQQPSNDGYYISGALLASKIFDALQESGM